MFSRRQLCKAGAASLLLPGSNAFLFAQEALLGSEGEFDFDALDLGVASGDPSEDAVTLWTKIPLPGQSKKPSGSMDVFLEVSDSMDFNPGRTVAALWLKTDERQAYTVKTRLEGLSPSSIYFYRFTAGNGYRSRTGRTKTLPAASSRPKSFRIGIASCQQYVTGYFNVLKHMASQPFDLCVHLGDYVYDEGGRGLRNDLINDGKPISALEDYRKKYMLYLNEPQLQTVRALFPWVHTWSDHEVTDNYAGRDFSAEALAQRRSAYQAYSEFMPTQESLSVGTGLEPRLQLHQSLKVGQLAEIFVTDLRQFKDVRPCKKELLTKACNAIFDESRSTLGREQKDWFKDALGGSDAKWKLIANEVMFIPFKLLNGDSNLTSGSIFGHEYDLLDSRYINLDAWDGFPAERQELCNFYAAENIQNIVYCTGDIHNFFTAEVRREIHDNRSPNVAVEVVTASVSSPGLKEHAKKDFSFLAEPLLKRANQHLKYADLKHHGFIDLTLTENLARITFRAVDTILQEASKEFVLFEGLLASGTNRIVPVPVH